MILPREELGIDDIRLEKWRLFEVSLQDGPPTRHAFGWAINKGFFVICSPILEETGEWCRTRTRRYWKVGPPATNWDREEYDQFWEFLSLWRVPKAEIISIAARLGKAGTD
jgi:hypothetical protein